MRRRRLVLPAALACALGGCEPRIEEPLPPPGSGDRTAPVPPRTSAAGEASRDAPARCIRPTPELPARVPSRDGGADPACPPDPEDPPRLRTGKVGFEGARGASITVEIAERDRDRQRGLMYRKSLPEDRGMLFAFERSKNHTFWMHDTCIELDMLFIAEDGLIVGIEESTPTMSDATFQVGCPSRYVLEVAAGWSRRHGVSAGQRVTLQGI